MKRDITIYDIAKALGISGATVSRALKDHPAINAQTRKKVRAMADSMGYQSNHFASNLRKRRTNTIGVIIPRLNSYFVSTALSAMEKVASEAGYNIIIAQSMESASKEMANAQTLFNSRVDGLLVSMSADSKSVQAFVKFTEKNIPLIFFDQVPDHTQHPCIVIDNKQSAYEVTKHLIEQGCRRIAHLTGNTSRYVYRERLLGYRMALAEAGIAFEEELVLHSDLTEVSATGVCEQIMAMPEKPDALFAANDMTAASCLRVFKERGWSVPQDIAIAGFNNDHISRVVEPNITTVDYPAYQLGETAAVYLINHLTGKASLHATNKVILRSELLVRDSTRRLS